MAVVVPLEEFSSEWWCGRSVSAEPEAATEAAGEDQESESADEQPAEEGAAATAGQEYEHATTTRLREAIKKTNKKTV